MRFERCINLWVLQKVIGSLFNTVSHYQSAINKLSPRGHGLSSHKFVAPGTVPGVGHISQNSEKLLLKQVATNTEMHSWSRCKA